MAPTARFSLTVMRALAILAASAAGSSLVRAAPPAAEASSEATQSADQPTAVAAAPTLDDLAAGQVTIVDLSYPLNGIERWEAEHGRIPTRAIVLLRTGWGRFWNEPARYQNHDLQGRMHFPGYSAEAVEYLLKERLARGVGLDTMSVDFGLSRDFAVHHVLGKAGAFGLENLARLDELPARSFWLSVAPIKIETGTGGPARLCAIAAASSIDFQYNGKTAVTSAGLSP